MAGMILMYHNIAAEAGFNTVAHAAFAAQIQFIMTEKKIIPLEEYVRILLRGNDLRKYAVFTFDDGYASFKTFVLPVLEKCAAPAALFIPVYHVGKTNSWEREGLPEYPLLSWDDLIRISGHGLVTLGSHGLSHKSLKRLPYREQNTEISESKRELESRLGMQINHFSYPYGQKADFSRKTLEIVRRNGYMSACSTLYGRTSRLREQYSLRRIEIRPQDTFDQFRRLCTTDTHMVFVKQHIKEAVHWFYSL
jgi:peptidoglycan/xylan/chitin deacetylase (PgdA/CDA1 family)